MLWKESEAVPEGKYPVLQQEEFGSGESTLADVYRLFEEIFDRQQERMDSVFDGMDNCFDRWNKKLDEISDEMRKMDEHVTRLEHGARQPRLAVEADGQANTKTRERTEGAATAGQAIRGNGFSARLVEPSPNTNSTSFVVKAEPSALPCRDDVVVESGAAASESCLPSLEMRSSTAAGGLVSTGEASTAKEINFIQPPFRFCSTEETDLEAKKSWTSAPSASYSAAASSRRRTCLLLPTAGGSLTQNPGKTGPLIQAVCKLVHLSHLIRNLVQLLVPSIETAVHSVENAVHSFLLSIEYFLKKSIYIRQRGFTRPEFFLLGDGAIALRDSLALLP